MNNTPWYHITERVFPIALILTGICLWITEAVYTVQSSGEYFMSGTGCMFVGWLWYFIIADRELRNNKEY